MRARLRMAAKASDQRQVQTEVVHEPLDIRAGVVAEDLDDLRLLCPAAEGVRVEDLVRVEDAVHALRAGVRSVDPRRRLSPTRSSK